MRDLLAVADDVERERERERERRRLAREKRMRYFAAHAGHLASGRVIGSGAVEKQAKSLGCG